MSKFLEIWDRKKDGENRPGRSFVRWVIVTTFLCLLFLLLKKDNLYRWIEAGIQIHGQKKQIEYYEKEIERLGTHVEMLRSNRDSLEKFAREKYGYCAPGEDLFIVE